MKEYIDLGWTVDISSDMNREKKSQRIRSWWKAFITIKDVLKAKLDKTLCANLFNSTILHASLCGAFNKFPDFFVQAFKIVVDS